MSSTTDSGSLNDVIHFKFRSPLALKLTAYLGNSLSTGSLHVRIAAHITLGFKPPPPVGRLRTAFDGNSNDWQNLKFRTLSASC